MEHLRVIASVFCKSNHYYVSTDGSISISKYAIAKAIILRLSRERRKETFKRLFNQFMAYFIHLNSRTGKIY